MWTDAFCTQDKESTRTLLELQSEMTVVIIYRDLQCIRGTLNQFHLYDLGATSVSCLSICMKYINEFTCPVSCFSVYSSDSINSQVCCLVLLLFQSYIILSKELECSSALCNPFIWRHIKFSYRGLYRSFQAFDWAE